MPGSEQPRRRRFSGFRNDPHLVRLAGRRRGQVLGDQLLNAEDLGRVFSCVRAALRPGGLFVFDLSLEQAYKTEWQRSCAIVEEDEAALSAEPTMSTIGLAARLSRPFTETVFGCAPT